MSPKLGWIQSFLCVVEHFDFDLAGKELGVSGAIARKRVQDLEIWLRKILILDDVIPPELSDIDGVPFLEIAWDVLKRFEAACSRQNSEAGGLCSTRQAKKIAHISLDDLQRFLTVGEVGSFKAAASVMSCNVTTLQRSIKSIELITKTQLFTGHASLTLTADGNRFKNDASYIVNALTSFRAPTPSHVDSSREQYRGLYNIATNQLIRLKSTHSVVANMGKKQRGRIRSVDVQSEMDKWQKVKDYLSSRFGPFKGISGNDVDMEK